MGVFFQKRVISMNYNKRLIVSFRLFSCYILLFSLVYLPFPLQAVMEGNIADNGDVEAIEIHINIHNSLSFKGIIEMSGEITGYEGNYENILLSVYKDQDEVQTYTAQINEGGMWFYDLDVSEFQDGFYFVQATFAEIESNHVSFEVDNTPPTITIDHPVKEYINEAKFQVRFNEEISYGLLSVTGNDKEWSDDFTNTIYFTGSDYLFLTILEYDEGEYNYSISVTDLAGNRSEETGSFILDTTRPFIFPNTLFPQPNMSQVPIISEDGTPLLISMVITDNHQLQQQFIGSLDRAIEVFEKGQTNPIAGTVEFSNGVITFQPTEPLNYNQKYYVIVHPFLTDNAGNFIHPRNWSFTTETNTDVESPHGNYLSNTNTCKTCHSVHTSSKPLLEEPRLDFSNGPQEEIEEITNKQLALVDVVTGYCMACHDGTVASPMTDALHSTSHHNKSLINKEGKTVSQSCGNCHNVHLASGSNNPTLLKDHFTFDHEGIDGVELIDSSVELCESCHDTDSLERMLDLRVEYEVFPYRNWNSSLPEGESFGSSRDYQLCLRCHNERFSNDYENVVDIESFYFNSASGHYISNHNRPFLNDGSYLNGHIPCADCHATHYSANVKLLSEYFGHNYQVQFLQPDLLEDGKWSVERERAFCFTCHNNSTELYGITVSFQEMNAQGEEIVGHTSTTACSACHGGTIREAAHAPIRLTNKD